MCSYAPRANLDVQTHLLRGFLWAASETGGGIRERMWSFQARPQAISPGPTSRPPWVPDRKVEIGECSESKLVGAEAHGASRVECREIREAPARGGGCVLGMFSALASD